MKKQTSWRIKNKGIPDKIYEEPVVSFPKKSRLPATKRSKSIEVEGINRPIRQKFYCTVCKMATWIFHEHDGRNTSETRSRIKDKSETTNIHN